MPGGPLFRWLVVLVGSGRFEHSQRLLAWAPLTGVVVAVGVVGRDTPAIPGGPLFAFWR